MRKLIYLIVASLAFAACEKIVEVDLPSEENRLVIEGQITSTKEPWKVRLTSSQPYFNQNEATTISNAIVRITGTDGQDILLSHTDTGMFVSDDPILKYQSVVDNFNEIALNEDSLKDFLELLPKPEIDADRFRR